MTREQAKQKLISYGNAEPTEEQITDFLNTLGSELKKEKDRADGYKAKADTAAIKASVFFIISRSFIKLNYIWIC